MSVWLLMGISWTGVILICLLAWLMDSTLWNGIAVGMLGAQIIMTVATYVKVRTGEEGQ